MILAAPSESAAQIVHTVYNDIPVIVLPHLQYDVRKHSAVRKNVQNIAYIGLANEYKGWDAFCTIYRQLRQDYQFFCLGKCDKNLRVDGITYVDIGKDKFQNGLSMTEGLKKYGIDIVYIGSTGPETYSYTYFEAFEAGCFVLTYKISGNVSSQVSINKNGKVFASAQEMINWLSDKKGVEQAVNAVHIHIENVRDHDAFMKYFDKN